MGEHQSPHQSPSLHHCLQEGRDFHILNCSLRFLFTFPFLSKPPWLKLTALLFPTFRTALRSWKRRWIWQMPCYAFQQQGSGGHRRQDRHFAQALAANMRQMIYLIPFEVLLHEWDVLLDNTNVVTWRNLSCQKRIIKWKVFSSEIFNLFLRTKALLLLHFRTDSLAVSILLNQVST